MAPSMETQARSPRHDGLAIHKLQKDFKRPGRPRGSKLPSAGRCCLSPSPEPLCGPGKPLHISEPQFSPEPGHGSVRPPKDICEDK